VGTRAARDVGFDSPWSSLRVRSGFNTVIATSDACSAQALSLNIRPPLELQTYGAAAGKKAEKDSNS